MTKFRNLKVGSKLSETQYYRVEKIQDGQVQLRNDYNEPIVVTTDYVEKCLVSADQYYEEKTMSRTDIVNLFLASTNIVLTVNYNKQVDENEVRKQLYLLYPNKGGKILSESSYRKKVAEAIESALSGEERTMIGRHYGTKDEFGRIRFIDMEKDKDTSKDYDTRQRLVDPRTIKYVILKGIKYSVK
jgi:hypothetical protein